MIIFILTLLLACMCFVCCLGYATLMINNKMKNAGVILVILISFALLFGIMAGLC